jgi:rhodanese-related sulfurtransferase
MLPRNHGKKRDMQDNTPSARVRAEEIDTTTMPVLDARTHTGKEQIRGALRYDPKALMAEEHLTLPLPHDGRIVVYADNEDRAEEIARRLRDQGYADAAVLEGGFEAYRRAGLPVEEITQEQPVPGQQGAGVPRI